MLPTRVTEPWGSWGSRGWFDGGVGEAMDGCVGVKGAVVMNEWDGRWVLVAVTRFSLEVGRIGVYAYRRIGAKAYRRKGVESAG